MYRRNQKGLATWAKWLIGITATFLVLGLICVCLLGYAVFNGAKEATNPDSLKKLAATMVTITDPLPEPYKYSLGMNILNTATFVTITDESNQYSYSLVQMPNTQGSESTASELVDELAAKGVPSTSEGGGNSKISVQEKSSMPVGGVDMPYVMGLAENRGKEVPALMGVVTPNQKNVLMLIVFGPPTAKTVDVEETKKFFANISAFK